MKRIFAAFLIVTVFVGMLCPIGVFAVQDENIDETILEIINSQGEFSNNINTNKRNTGVFKNGSTQVGVCATVDSKIEWTVRGQFANGGRINIQFKNDTDLSKFKDETYFETGIYCDAENAADLPQNVRLVDSAANYIEAPIKPFEPKKHTTLKIKLSEFTQNAAFQFDKVRQLRFMLPEKLSGDGSLIVDGAEEKGWFHIYTDNMRIARGDAAEISLSQQDSTVVIGAETNCKDAKYKFYCNDILIAESDNPTYTYETDGKEQICNFRVEVYTADGEFFAKDEKKLALYKADNQSIFTIVGNDGVFTDNIAKTDIPNNRSAMILDPSIGGYWSGYGAEASDNAILPLNKSQKWVVHGTEFNSAMWRIHFSKAQNFSDIRIGGYLSFLIYCNAATKADLPTNIALYNDNDVTKASFPQGIKLNEWNIAKVYFTDFDNMNFDFENVNRIEMSFPSKLSGKSEYDGTEEHNGWYDLYVGNMYIGSDLDFEPKTYAEKPIISDAEYSELFDGSVIFAVGARGAAVNGFKKTSSVENGVIRIENTVYLAAAFAEEYFGVSLPDDTKVVYHNNVKYVSADAMANAAGKILTEKNGVLVFADTQKEISSGKADKIEKALKWEIGHINNGAEGFVTGMIIHPKEPSLMYCRTDVGGCYRWDDKAQIWKQLMMSVPNDERNLVGVQSLALDPNDTDIVYALCGTFSGSKPYDLLKSEDRGETWQRTYLNKSVVGNITRISGERVAVDPNNSNIVWVGTNSDGLWYSENGGKTWAKNTAIGDGIGEYGLNIVLFDENSANDGRSTHIYVSSFGDGLYESTDAGKTFVKIENSPEQINRMKIANGRLYVAALKYTQYTNAERAGVFYLENGKWTNITPKAEENADSEDYVTGFSDILVDYTNPNFLVAAGRNSPKNFGYQYRFRSNDGGKTWEWFRGSEDIGACQLVQDLRNPNRVYDVHGRGLWMYEDIHAEFIKENGWRKIVPTTRFQDGIYEDVALKTVSLPSADAPMLLIGDYDAGYMYSEDKKTLAKMQDSETKDWVHYGMTLDLDYCEQQPKYNARVGRYENKGYVVLSDKYGRFGVPASGWDTQNHAFACAVAADVSENGYPVVIAAASKNGSTAGALYRSSDWGKNWEKLNDVAINVSDSVEAKYRDYVLISDTVDKNTFYYSEDSSFYASTDGGISWEKIYDFGTGFSTTTIYAYPKHEGEVWLCSGGKVYISKDRGSSWELTDMGGEIKYLSFGKGRSDMPALYAYASFSGTWGFYISDDNGESWERMDDDGRNYAVAEVTQITGDNLRYGRAFVSTGGAGILYLEKNTEESTAKVSSATIIDSSGGYPLANELYLLLNGWSAVNYPRRNERSFLGGQSSKWDYDTERIGTEDCVIQIRMRDKEKTEVSNGDALEFLFYTDAADVAYLPNMISIFASDGKSYNYFDAFKNAVTGEWNYVSIPLSKFGITEKIKIDRIELLGYKNKKYSSDFSLYLEGMKFAQKAFETSVKAAKVGETVRVSANSGENIDAEMYVAAYDKNGILLSVQKAGGTTAEHSLAEGESSVKFFLFESASSIKPLTVPLIIDAEN